MVFWRTKPPGRDLFCPYSLGDWLTLCDEVEIPYIRAQEAALVECNDWRFFDQEGPHQDRLAAALKQMEAAVKSWHGDVMLRVADIASGGWIKGAMAHEGPAWQEQFALFSYDDPRLYDMLNNWPRTVMPIWMRPWAEAEIVDGFPVEYRAYIEDGKVAGISSYYPQRPLRQNTEELMMVRASSITLAEVLLERLPFQWPAHYSFPSLDSLRLPELREDRGCAFTVDWLVEAVTGRVLFLEGGPPHDRGAHPCCFKPGEIEGVALVDRNVDE